MKSRYFFSGMVATIGVALFHVLIYPYLFAANFGNVSYYVLISVIFFAVFFISDYFIDYFKIEIARQSTGFIAFYLILFAVWFVSMYFFENESYYFSEDYSLRHRIPFYLYFSFLLLASACVFLFLSKIKKNIKFLRIISAVALSITQTVVLFAPNIINDHGGNLFHIHAYFNPVYNIVKGLPYDDIIASIYGHYPLFYYLPMKFLSLFGIPMIHSAMIITMIFGFVSFLLIYIALSKFIKRDGLFYISIVSISYISFYYYQSGQYYQMLPHRILFPAITLFVLSVFYLKKIPAWIQIVVSAAGLLWNFESGIICLIILTFYSVFINAVFEKKRSFKDYFWEVIKCILSFAVSFGLLNVFNFALGGRMLSVKDFIYPIMSNDFEISGLAIKIPTFLSLYFLEFAVLMLLLCIIIVKIFKKSFNKEELYLASVTLMGLGMFPYYFNRAAFANVSIVHIPFLFALCYAVQLFFDEFENTEKKYKKGMMIGSVSVIFAFFCMGALSGIPLSINDRVNSSWKTDEYDQLCDIIKTYIPSDAAAVGPGLTDIYTSLGWEPQIYVMDWSDWDCSQTKREYALKEINSKERILLCDSSAVKSYLDKNDWVTVEFLFDAFYYLERIDENTDKKDFILLYSDNNDYSIEDFIDLCFLNCYENYSDDERMNYYLAVYDIVKDRGVLYDFILDDYNINKFGFENY